MIIYIHKDITTVKGSNEKKAIIAHGVNCQRAMGSGVAKALYEKWPSVRRMYMQVPVEHMTLGKVQTIDVEPNTYVANCWTQEYYGRDFKRYANPLAIYSCLSKCVELCISLNADLYIPRIGCGLAGLDWNKDVQPMIEQLADDIPIYVCDL